MEVKILMPIADLGAEKTATAAEKHGKKITVEIKSFISFSPILVYMFILKM